MQWRDGVTRVGNFGRRGWREARSPRISPVVVRGGIWRADCREPRVELCARHARQQATV